MKTTPLHPLHVAAGARLVDFAGWEMPVQYREGILAEHLATRRGAGLFDVSHMGRFEISGRGAVPFLRRVLSNDAALLTPGQSHYTLIPTATGGALDDAWLYRVTEERWLLVVNAANREADWACLQRDAAAGGGVLLKDVTEGTAMVSIQGPACESLLQPLLDGALPPPRRNTCTTADFQGRASLVGRTGYTGEPLGFEVVLPAARVADLWTRLTAAGATPVGLGARDTLRLEAGLPLFGHELGLAPDGSEIPILASPATRFGVALTAGHGEFVGREALAAQAAAIASLQAGGPGDPAALPKRVYCLALADRGIARAGAEVVAAGRLAGHVTSGTMVPYWEPDAGRPGTVSRLRALALAYLHAGLRGGSVVTVHVRERALAARVVERFINSRTGPYAVPVLS